MDFLLYVGYTTDIERRLNDHNAGKTKSTAKRRPLELIFVSTIFLKPMREGVKGTSKQRRVKRQSN
jgi:predicted GIY-YIG superfamily endonuclease